MQFIQPQLLVFLKRLNANELQKEYRLAITGSKYLTIPHGADIDFERTDSFTYSFYVKFESSMIGLFTVIASKRASTGPGIQFFKSDVEQCYLAMIASTQNVTVRGTFTISASVWHLITLVYSGSPTTVRFYVDGKADLSVIVGANTLTSQSVKNTAAMTLGTRLNSPLYANMQFGEVYIHNRALNVNEVPDRLWNYGVPRIGTTVANCVRDYRFNLDIYNSGYTLIDSISGTNGASVNMNGTELVNMNSVMTPTPLNVQASPCTSTQNTIGFDSAGSNCGYDIEVSDDGSTGWVRVASNLLELYYNHTVGAASTLKYYRVKANGYGSVSSYSSVVSATTLSSSYTDVYYYNTRRLADNSYNFALSVETQRVAPVIYYDSISNKSYIVFMSRAEQGYDMAIFIYYYDHVLGTFISPKYVGLKSRQGLDRHPIPAVIVADDGHIIVSATDFHNAPLQMFRSDTPGNIDKFTRLGEIGTINDYPEFRKFSNGDIAVFSRYYVGGSLAGICVFLSTDDGVTWGSQINILQYGYSVGRPYPMLMPQPETSDRVHIMSSPRNDSGGPFPGDPDKVGYFKDQGYAYADYGTDGVTTWHSAGNVFSKSVAVTAITAAQWIANYLFNDSVGTQENGLPVGVASSSGVVYIIAFTDAGTYKVFYWNGSSWTAQVITFSDGILPDSFTFGYHGVQALVITGTALDIYCTKSGVVKWYTVSDITANGNATLQDANFLPAIGSLAYERGAITQNIHEATEPLLLYSIKTVPPTPLPTSPGAWADAVFKKLW